MHSFIHFSCPEAAKDEGGRRRKMNSCVSLPLACSLYPLASTLSDAFTSHWNASRVCHPRCHVDAAAIRAPATFSIFFASLLVSPPPVPLFLLEERESTTITSRHMDDCERLCELVGPFSDLLPHLGALLVNSTVLAVVHSLGYWQSGSSVLSLPLFVRLSSWTLSWQWQLLCCSHCKGHSL